MTYSMSLRSERQSVAPGGAKRNPGFLAPDESKPALAGERFCRPLKRAAKNSWTSTQGSARFAHLSTPAGLPRWEPRSPWALLCRPLRGLVDACGNVELNSNQIQPSPNNLRTKSP